MERFERKIELDIELNDVSIYRILPLLDDYNITYNITKEGESIWFVFDGEVYLVRHHTLSTISRTPLISSTGSVIGLANVTTSVVIITCGDFVWSCDCEESFYTFLEYLKLNGDD